MKSFLVPIVMFGFIPFVVLLFTVLTPRRAVLAAYISAWMFLPMAGYSLPGLPDYTKVTAATIGVLLGMLLFDPGRALMFRPHWFDLPMLIWCLCPFASSVNNDLGVYDGLASVFGQLVLWGIPYFIGRVYFTDADALRDIAVGVFIGGLVYVPLCLWEVRMSPQLHYTFYGFYPHVFGQHIRAGGYRPMVFMQHGLMVGMWMASASLVGVWLWRTGALKRLWGVPVAYLVPVLLVTTVLCKTMGALGLLVMGVGLLFTLKWTKWSLPVWCLVLLAPMYMAVRASGTWSGEHAISAATTLLGERRGDSLRVRIEAEELLMDKALSRPAFGWGGWGRSRVHDEWGKDIAVTDGMWVIALGQNGLVGLAALTVTVLLPLVVLTRRFPVRHWSHPSLAPAAALAVLMGLWMLDNLMNAMINPVYLLTVGGVVAFGLRQPAARPRPAAQPARLTTPGFASTVPRPGGAAAITPQSRRMIRR